MEIKLPDLLYMRQTKWFGVGWQIVFVVALYFGMVAVAYYQYPHHSVWLALYRPYPYMMYAPVYEEIIFRGLILSALTRFYSVRNAIIISAILFGLWHAKNFLILPADRVWEQILYAGVILGPLFAYITIKTKNLWWGVMLHYLNNILAPFSPIVLAWLLGR